MFVISSKQLRGVVMDVALDENADLEREKFTVNVKVAKPVVVSTLPVLGKTSFKAKEG